jgi:CHAT domain-containing protein/Tfp pilus assembly protein PilF
MFKKIVFILIFTFLVPHITYASASVYTSKTSRIYHSRNCSELNTDELIEFYSPQEADKMGGIPCKHCNQAAVVEENISEVKIRSTKQLDDTRKPRTTYKWVGKSVFKVNGRRVKNVNVNSLKEGLKSKWREYLYDVNSNLNNRDENEKNFLADDYMYQAKELAKQGKYIEAAMMCEKSVQAERASQRPRMANLANELSDAGHFYLLVNQHTKALKYKEEALAIARKLDGEEAFVAVDLNNIGKIYSSWNQYEKALKYYEEALAIARKLGREDIVAVCQYSIGHIYCSWGQYDKAIKLYEEALEIDRRLCKDADVASGLNSLGIVYDSWGQYDKALKYFEEALAIARKLGQEDKVASKLNNIGSVYYAWGQYDMALKYYEEALAIARKLGEQEANVTAYLNNIGDVYYSLRKYVKALKYFEEALAIARKLETREGGVAIYVADYLNNIGDVYRSWGQYDKALKHYEEALVIARKLGQEAYVADCHYHIGCVYNIWGQYDKALKHYEEALAIARKLKVEDQIARDLNGIGDVYYNRKDYQTAIRYFKESVIRKEKLRKTAIGSIRRDYLASQFKTYQQLTSAYIRDDNIFDAFQTIERSRAKLLVERLTNHESNTKQLNIKESQQTLREDAAILIYANVDLQDVVQIAITSEEITGKEVSNKSFVQSYVYKYDKPIKTLLENQRSIKVTKKDINDQPLPAIIETKGGFDDIINYYRSLLMNPSLQDERGLKIIAKIFKNSKNSDTKELGKGLYKLLIKPLEAQIKGKKDLIIVPDGILAFVPFETLIDEDGKYLVENYRITYTQSMGIRELIKERKYKKERKPLLAFGGGVYNEVSYDVDMIKNDTQLAFLTKNLYSDFRNDRSVRNAYGALGIGYWSNLPGTLNEVKNIKKVINKSVIFTGMDVTEKNIKELSRNGELSEYKVIHFATHGLVVPEVPELSAIVLSQFKRKQGREDGYLRMGEIAKLNIKADFVNLSACETGLGKIYGGEGVVGLTQSFLLAGANAVSVSLWQVADESTSRFMVTMYNLVKDRDMNYADTMTEIKRQFINGDFGDKYKAPFYWAPFVYYGNDTLTVKETTKGTALSIQKGINKSQRESKERQIPDNKLSVPQQETSLKKLDRYVEEDKVAASPAFNQPDNIKLKETDRPVLSGLTKNEVLKKLGQPDTVDKWSVSEIWHYRDSYVEFENDILIRCYEPHGEGVLKAKLNEL